MTSVTEETALDLEAVKAHLERVDGAGGLGYDAHDAIRDAIALLAALSRAPGAGSRYEALGRACEAHGLGWYNEQGEMRFQPPGDMIAEQAVAEARAALSPPSTGGEKEGGDSSADLSRASSSQTLSAGQSDIDTARRDKDGLVQVAWEVQSLAKFGGTPDLSERDAMAALAERALLLAERLQAIIDWSDLALHNPQEFDSHGVRNLDGPVFDEARAVLAALGW